VSVLSRTLRSKLSTLNYTFNIPKCLKYINKGNDRHRQTQHYYENFFKYSVFHKNVLYWTVNGASTHARQLVALYQVLCSLYGLTCVGYAQNVLEFVSRSSLIRVAGRSFCLFTESLFAQFGDSNDKCSSSLEVECWNEDETHGAQQSPTEL